MVLKFLFKEFEECLIMYSLCNIFTYLSSILSAISFQMLNRVTKAVSVCMCVCACVYFYRGEEEWKESGQSLH